MKIKLLITSMALAGLTFTTIDYAEAKGHQEYRRSNIELSPVEIDRLESMREAQIEKMRPLQNELQVKRMELRAFSNNPNVKPELISKLSREIVSLQNQVSDERQAFRDKVEDEFGIEFNRKNQKFGRGNHMKNHGNYHGNYHDNCRGRNHSL